MRVNSYFDDDLNQERYQLPRLFPTPNHRNLVICVGGLACRRDGVIFICDCIPDLNNFDGGCQCFPLYWYDDSTADIADLFSAQQSDADRYVRRDGVTDWILSTARKQYGSRVTKEDIFYYVYGILMPRTTARPSPPISRSRCPDCRWSSRPTISGPSAVPDAT